MSDTIRIVDPNACYGCGACSAVCPKRCIRMEDNAEGFPYPHIDESACVQCGKCTAACPALHPAAYPFAPQAFAVVNEDAQIRSASSSGGVFHAVAKEIIRRSGVVFGVEFDGEFGARHAFAETEEDMRAFCRSKYLQSNTGDCFSRAKAFLDGGRLVLFSGTSCQIAGLKQFLGREYENLFTIDLICSGVASPALWKKYLQSFRQGKPTAVSFRDKPSGWAKFCVKIEFPHYTYLCMHREDPYMQMFLDGMSIRECCYRCGFRKQNIAADLTLADFWGIDRVAPELNDNQGLSLVLTHTEKGLRLLRDAENLTLTSVDAGQALEQNVFASTCHTRNPRRDKYLQALPNRRFSYLYDKCYHSTNTEKLKAKIAGMIGYKG